MIVVLILAVLAVVAGLFGFGAISSAFADLALIAFFALAGVIVLVLATARSTVNRSKRTVTQTPYERGASADPPG